MKQGVLRLSIAIGEEPPNEFRIFVAGWNETENGRVLFDLLAARDVMAAYKKHGVDRMIDLEHLSLEDPQKSVNFDPDARGWAKLELRADGSLWAVNVKWTPDGDQRLRDKRQRYVSPAFMADRNTKRVTKVLNIAITAMPATHQTPELMTAAAEYGDQPMDPALLELLGLGADATLEDVIASVGALKKKMGEALGDGPAEAEAPPADAPADMPEAMAEEPPPPPEEDPKKAETVAATARLTRLSGKASLGEAVREVEVWRASHVALETERAKLTKERDALEAGERRSLVAQLVKLGVEIPATAWLDDKAQRPSKRLTAEPIEDLRDRVTKLSVARGGRMPAAPEAPITAAGLSARELEMCRTKKIDPAKYAETRARISARSRVEG